MKHYSHYWQNKNTSRSQRITMPQHGFFYAINNVSITFSKVSSSHHELKQLKCVLCYPIVFAHVGLRKGGIINYKSANKISALQKHLETSHQKIWIKWIEREKAIRLGHRRSIK